MRTGRPPRSDEPLEQIKARTPRSVAQRLGRGAAAANMSLSEFLDHHLRRIAAGLPAPPSANLTRPSSANP